MNRPHSSPWAIKYSHLPLDLIDDEDPLHPSVGLDGTTPNLLTETSFSDVNALSLLASLPDRDLALLVALYWEGKGVRQYARELGVCLKTVQKRRNRILRDLRKELEAPTIRPVVPPGSTA